MIRFLSLACCTLMLAGLSAVAVATSPSETSWTLAAANNAEGTIKTVDSAKKMFTLTTKDGDLDVMVTDTTVYTLDGKTSTMADALKAGRTAKVTHTDRTASRVEVTSVKSPG
jgi:hypothetical protein